VRTFLVSVVAMLAFAASAVGAQAATCTVAGKGTTIGGKAAQVYCGPAKATVRIGGKTMTIRGGTCGWSTNSFRLQTGTIFLFRGKPLQQQPGFSIFATGIPVARALIEVYWQGTYYWTSTLHATARPNASLTGGTFQGKLGKTGTGPAISGTISCA
jgi:hypothetical protein